MFRVVTVASTCFGILARAIEEKSQTRAILGPKLNGWKTIWESPAEVADCNGTVQEHFSRGRE